MMDNFSGVMDLIGDIVLPDKTDEKPLAMAFVRSQPEPDAMPTDKAFSSGTLFYSLEKPFLAGGEK